MSKYNVGSKTIESCPNITLESLQQACRSESEFMVSKSINSERLLVNLIFRTIEKDCNLLQKGSLKHEYFAANGARSCKPDSIFSCTTVSLTSD